MTDGVKVTYAWGVCIRASHEHPWGAIREAYEDEWMDAEDRAKDWVEREAARVGRGNVRLLVARIETHPWKDHDKEVTA